jgi:hypothetical protein
MKWRFGWVNYKVGLLQRKFWFHWWTPSWHEDRGSYVSIGLWMIASF